MGHGHVTPNPDGSRARCGGPAICAECSKEAYALKTETGKAAANHGVSRCSCGETLAACPCGCEVLRTVPNGCYTCRKRVDERRLRAVLISPDDVAALLLGRYRIALAVGMPADVEIAGAGFSVVYGQFCIHLRHPSFEPVPEGQMLPECAKLFSPA